MRAKSLVICVCIVLVAFVLHVALASAKSHELPKVVVVATGGTIAMKLDPDTGNPVPAVTGDELVSAVPEIKDIAEIEVVEFSNIPSDYMTPERWVKLSKTVDETLKKEDVVGVVITHGTDTLEETAFFLDLTLKSEKPVVCIGAQRSASEEDSDGPRNLLNAVRIVTSPSAEGKGVMLAMNHYINAARPVTKTHTSNVQTFKSGDYGYIGYVDKDKVIFYHEPLRRQKLDMPDKLPEVDLIPMYPGANGDHVRYAVDKGVKGIVVSGYGWGNVNDSMYEALKYAIDNNVPVAMSTRVYNGRVLPVYGFKGGGATLKDIGVVFTDDLTPWKARIVFMLALSKTQDHKKLQEYFNN